MSDNELADLDGTDPPERDDWITDVDATIHDLMSDDGENDATNDWVHDVACALWKQVGLRDLATIAELRADLAAWENLEPLSPDPERVQLRYLVKENERLRAERDAWKIEAVHHSAASDKYRDWNDRLLAAISMGNQTRMDRIAAEVRAEMEDR